MQKSKTDKKQKIMTMKKMRIIFPHQIKMISEEETNEAPEEEIMVEEKTPSRYVQKNHPETQILGEKEAGVQTRRTITEPQAI
jgi:hypothetical protein